mmetsp:Transcript_31271/g.23236  ORF Transcript_31271/g.23236 Transcript_31271/m.23236 type:complete len:231 (-) Transcript_31271:1656-2348(-)
MVGEEHRKGFFYRELPDVAKVVELSFKAVQAGKYELMEALGDLLEVLKVPFEKERASDENEHVPNLPLLFNALCSILKWETRSDDEEIAQQLELIDMEIANVISEIASYGVQDIKDQEASLEDKMIYGSETSPLQRLYKNGNRNLKGIANSEVPETLVNVLAQNAKSKDTIVAIIEAIANTALYHPNAEKYAQMGVLKDLVRILSDAPDFRSYIVHISIEAIWNLIEVEG